MSEISVEEIDKVLEEKIRPNLALHGGDIKIESIREGTLSMRMLGQCSGCPSANLTMENLVNTELKEAFPELKQVFLVTGVSDSLILEAKQMLQKKHNRNSMVDKK